MKEKTTTAVTKKYWLMSLRPRICVKYFLCRQLFLKEQEKIFYTHSGPKNHKTNYAPQKRFWTLCLLLLHKYTCFMYRRRIYYTNFSVVTIIVEFLVRGSKARNMRKIFSLVPSKKPVTREKWDKLSVYSSIFEW